MPKPPEIKLPEISSPSNGSISSLTAVLNVAPNSDSKQPGGASAQASVQVSSGKKDSMPLPPMVKQEPLDKTPAVTADSTKPPVETSPNQSLSTGLKVFTNKEQALKNSSDSGIFDTQGYPREKLDKYVSRIIGHIKERWFIPSNLKNFQGHTTVVFFIDKNGGFFDIRTVSGSGNKKLDITALNAIIDSDPVDPLPKDYPGNHLGAKFVFSYNEPD
jgi:outer membrane biosynthesis protein TonB